MNYKMMFSMRKIVITAITAFVLSVCCAMAHDASDLGIKNLKEGDLLFCVAEKSNNITDVTSGLGGKRIDHVAIFHTAKGEAFALEAIHRGVCLTPIDSFMARRQNVVCARLRDTTGVAQSVERAMEYIGTPYDFYFMPSDSAMYCSELVQKCYKTVAGELVFKPIPMSFHDKTGTITAYWRDYYARRGLRVPEGEPGSNPGDLSRSDKIVILGELRH